MMFDNSMNRDLCIGLCSGAAILVTAWKLNPFQQTSNGTNDSSKADSKPKPKHTPTNNNKNITKQGFSMSKVPSNLDAIIIGSGMGGLTTASLLAQQGMKVLVLEQHDVAGGNTHTWMGGEIGEKKYEFDTGLHYVGGHIGREGGKGLSAVRKQFDYVTGGRKIEWEAMEDNFDVAVALNDTGKRDEFRIHKDWKVLIPALKERFPTETAAIDQYFNHVMRACRYYKLQLLSKLLPQWLYNFTHSVFCLLLPDYTLLVTHTLSQVLDTLTPNTTLRGILAYQYGDYGETPSRGSFLINALLWDHFRGGGYYPIGGPAVIAEAIIPVIEGVGGRVLVRANVTRIVLEDSGGRLRVRGVEVKGKIITANIVVSSVGAPLTCHLLRGENAKAPYPPQLQREPLLQLLNSNTQNNDNDNSSVQVNEQLRSHTSLMSLFIGFEGDAEQLNLPKHNRWVFPTWDHTANFQRYDAQSKDSSTDAPVPFPAVFISFSSVKDPTFSKRYPNQQVALVIAPCSYDEVESFKDQRVKHRGTKYDALKSRWEDQLTSIFLHEFPQLKPLINSTITPKDRSGTHSPTTVVDHFQEVGTALTNDYYLGTYRGAVYGLGHTPQRFAEYALQPKPMKSLPNMYLTGQDVVTCGITGAMMGGYLTACQISRGVALTVGPLMV